MLTVSIDPKPSSNKECEELATKELHEFQKVCLDHNVQLTSFENAIVKTYIMHKINEAGFWVKPK